METAELYWCAWATGGRLTLVSHVGLVSGQPIELQQIYRRNAANVITATVLKSPLFLAGGFETDSLVTIHVYDAVSGRYVRSVSHFVLDNEPQSDSAVYAYDAAGRLASVITYFGDNSGYEPDSKAEYTYAGSNLATVKGYSYNGSTFVLDQTETYEYDSKVNPQQAVTDAPILGVGDFYSANNKTKRTTVTENPQETFVTNVAYTYNSSNRPTRANGSAAGSTSITSYYYQ